MARIFDRLKRVKRKKPHDDEGEVVPERAPLATKAAWRRLGAMGCILCIIVTWIAMAEVVQGIESSFPSPYFLRLCVHCFYALCLLLWAAWRFFPIKGRHKRQGVAVVEERELLDSAAPHADGIPNSAREVKIKTRIAPPEEDSNPDSYNYLGYFNWCYFFGASIFLAIITFASGWFWYISLPLTPVSGNSAIYQSMCTFVYLFSIVFLKERVTLLKTIAVVVSVIGVLMISFSGGAASESESSSSARLLAETLLSGGASALDGGAVVAETLADAAINATDSALIGAPIAGGGVAGAAAAASEAHEHLQPSLLGYLMCFISMVLYALYEVLYKKWASHSADPVPMMNSMRFLGLVGVSTLVFCAPFLLVVDLAGFEKFRVPTPEQWKLLAVVGLLDTVFNLFLLFCIMLSSPLFASIGCLLVLPASLVWDYFAHNYGLPLLGLLGVGCIVFGFVAFVIEEYKATLSSSATAPPLYDYEVVGGVGVAKPGGWTPGQEVELAPPQVLPWSHEESENSTPSPVTIGVSTDTGALSGGEDSGGLYRPTTRESEIFD